MHALIHAIDAFFDHLAAVRWRFLGIAVLCHLARTVAVSRAWRNTLAAAYDGTRIRWRDVYLGYLAGAGVNAVIPARSGDVVKLYVLKRRVPGSTYTTLASTLVVLTLFDFVVATSFFIWAVTSGFLPSLDVLPNLPNFDFSWFVRHRGWTLVIVGALAAAAFAAGVWAWERVTGFKRRVATGFAVLRDRGAYARRVALWQALDWAFRLVAVYWFLRAFGIPANADNALRIQVTQSLSTVFPFSPGGIGTEQAHALYVLAGQAGRSAVLAFSVGTHLTLIAVNVLLGAIAIAIAFRTFRLRQATAAAREARREATAQTPSA